MAKKYNGFDIIEYASRAQENFLTVPFGEGDGLVLSTLAYFRFENVSFGTTLASFYQNTSEKDLLYYAKNNGNYIRLLCACASSPRFCDITIEGYQEDNSWENRCQFSATLFRAESFCFASFRGTDENIIGWIEDLDLLGKDILPSQTLSLSFLQEAMALFPTLPFLVGGHSKGGNLAVFSASRLPFEERKRIQAIYNFDAPGFSDTVRNTDGFQEILQKVNKISPTMSLFGMLLDFDNLARPVYCKYFWVMQHDPFSWLFDESGKPLEAPKFHRISHQSKRSSQKVVKIMTAEQKLRFGDLATQVCEQANFFTMGDLSRATVFRMLSAIRKLNRKDRKIVWMFFGTFLKGYFY